MLRDFIAFQLARDFYRRCKRLKIPRFLQEQLLRASSSVALNLAEGSGKRTTAEQVRFYGIALGSFRECEAILELEEVHLDQDMKELIGRLGAILFRLSERKPNRETLPRTTNLKP